MDFQLLMAAVDGTEEGISDGSRKIPEAPVKHKTEVKVGQAILGLVESQGTIDSAAAIRARSAVTIATSADSAPIFS